MGVSGWIWQVGQRVLVMAIRELLGDILVGVHLCIIFQIRSQSWEGYLHIVYSMIHHSIMCTVHGCHKNF